MTNIIMKIKQQIQAAVKNAVTEAIGQGQLPDLPIPEITVEKPREQAHGDFSTNVAMQMARDAKKPPRQIAETIIGHIRSSGTYIDKVECAGPGFINFYLNDGWLSDNLRVIHAEGGNYGRTDIGKGKKVLVEFVSANPTGPLHMGNARGGALGDLIANVLEAAGYDVTREFYINDAGNQIERFGLSLEARYLQLLKGEDVVEFPEDGYHGDDIIEHAREYINLYGDSLLEEESCTRRDKLVKFALPKNIESIKKALERYGVEFDVWFSEQSLYDSGEVDQVLDYLKEKGYTKEEDGALWFKATLFGEDKDEVLVRKNGIPTYFASDIAYHRNKFEKRGFDRAINLLGADHHGHASRMKAVVKALGIDPDRLDIIIFQLVRLYRNGEIARMSKRTGKSITLEDLIDEVGRDAARFFFNTKASGSHLDFDLDLAVKQSNENPVYYVQYAHARICSMISLLKDEGIEVPDARDVNLSLLKREEEINLLRKIADLPEEIRISCETLEPSRLTRYVTDVASAFHSFYNACRVKGEEEELMKARLVLADCTRIVIHNVLKLLSIEAPHRM